MADKKIKEGIPSSEESLRDSEKCWQDMEDCFREIKGKEEKISPNLSDLELLKKYP